MLTGLPLLLVLLAAVGVLIVAISVVRITPVVALLLTGLATGLAIGMAPSAAAIALQTGFGALMGQIGLMVIAGTLLATYLDRARSAEKLATTLIALGGARRSPGILTGVGYLVGIPVFCDAGFLLLSPLVPRLAQRAATGARLYLTLAAGLFATHTLVPPTPGPVAAAGGIGIAAHLGLVMALGLVVALPAAVAGYLVLRRVDPRTAPAPATAATPPATAAPEAPYPAPKLWRAVLPVALPIGLIALTGLLPSGDDGPLRVALRFLGAPFVALLVGVGCVYVLAGAAARSAMRAATPQALAQAGNILLITGAGGAFGGILKAADLGSVIASVAGTGQASGGALLVVGFLLAALLKSAQGSTTAAMAIAGSILGGLVAGSAFAAPLPGALLVCAIGAGGMVASHVNDSYFWIVSQLSGLPTPVLLRYHTLASAAMGVVGLAATLLLYALLV